MSEFRSKLHVEVGEKSGEFILIAPLIYYSDILRRELTVPHGFKTDFASIPQLLQWLIQVNGKHRPAAVVHDYLCGREVQKMLGITQRTADKVLREASQSLDVRGTQNAAMYLAVRVYQSIAGIFR